jgi:hypothetical protein
MLHLPFLSHQNRDGLVLGRLGRFPIAPLFRVTASARTAHLHVIGMSGKGKSKFLEWCSYQDIAAGRTCGLIDPHSIGRTPALATRGQIYALKTPETVPEAVFEAYRSFVPPEPIPAVREPLTAPEGATLSERVKASVTVLEFVSQYVDLKPTASGAVGLCPFHDDHHPSFGVNAEGNYWHCFAGCGGGSVIDFWMKWRKCDFTTVVRELAEMVL